MTESGQSASLMLGFSLGRIRMWCLVLGTAGVLSAVLVAGAGATAAFAVGALASYFNFLLLHAMVHQLGPEPAPGRRKIISGFVLRYVVLGALGYATVKFFGVNPAPFCIGLTVAAFAALLDSISELIYARA